MTTPRGNARDTGVAGRSDRGHPGRDQQLIQPGGIDPQGETGRAPLPLHPVVRTDGQGEQQVLRRPLQFVLKDGRLSRVPRLRRVPLRLAQFYPHLQPLILCNLFAQRLIGRRRPIRFGPGARSHSGHLRRVLRPGVAERQIQDQH